MTMQLIILLCATFMPIRPSNDIYFPDRSFSESDETNGQIAGRYGAFLKAMEEPSLYSLSQDDRAVESYRLLWLPTFDRPVAVRLSKSGESVWMRVIQLSGRGGYEAGTVAVDITRKCHIDQWNDIADKLNRINFYQMSSTQEDILGISDGDPLVLEGTRAGEYHVIERLDPDQDFLNVVEDILNMTNLPIREIWGKYRDN